MKINILYEDSNFLAIDKPAGISVHADGRSKPARNTTHSVAGGEKTVTDWILKNYPKMENVGEPIRMSNSHQVKSYKVHKVKDKEDFQLSTFNFITIPRPGIVHRLDKDTSGVLLLAKNQKTYEFLKAQFQNREIKKTYHTIVSGTVREDRGIINKPIGRSPNDFRKRLAGRGARGELREAVTEYKVIKRFTSPQPSPERRGSPFPFQGKAGDEVKFTYLEVKPKTGRTHQIRVHMKFLNHPVVCDSLYNPGHSCPLGITRLALHAQSIEFKDIKGKVIKVESPLPKEFAKICSTC